MIKIFKPQTTLQLLNFAGSRPLSHCIDLCFIHDHAHLVNDIARERYCRNMELTLFPVDTEHEIEGMEVSQNVITGL